MARTLVLRFVPPTEFEQYLNGSLTSVIQSGFIVPNFGEAFKIVRIPVDPALPPPSIIDTFVVGFIRLSSFTTEKNMKVITLDL